MLVPGRTGLVLLLSLGKLRTTLGRSTLTHVAGVALGNRSVGFGPTLPRLALGAAVRALKLEGRLGLAQVASASGLLQWPGVAKSMHLVVWNCELVAIFMPSLGS